MLSDELYDLFRRDVVDTVRPYLWSDEEVYAYMNDAYHMFVRLTDGVPDFTSAATKVNYYADSGDVDIHPAIMRIRTANLEDGSIVRVINVQDINNLTSDDYGVLQALNTSTNVKGKVRYLVVGMEAGKGRVYNVPTTNGTINLVIERLPLVPLTEAGQELSDVAPHHQIHLLKWMEYMAYSKPDLETFNKARSDQKKADFEEYCALCKREKERAKHKVRVVRYGGL